MTTQPTSARTTASNPEKSVMPMTSALTEVVLPGRVEPAGLQLRRQESVVPAPGRVILQMEATGVSFAEQQMRRGKYFDQPPFPFVPGYDVVGTVVAVGEGAEPSHVGRRFAVVTKTGAWASRVDVAAGDLLPVPAELDPAAVETLIVNGITAWQMLHDTASASPGATIVVLGANGGVGGTLVQLARHAGIRVIGTAAASHHDLLRELGADAVDSHDPGMYDKIHTLAPAGVDAVFDHVGGPGLVRSWRLLRRGGTLVSYGTASTKDAEGRAQLPILALFARLIGWNLLPNGRTARFYNFWAGRRRRERFIERQREALAQVLRLLHEGAIRPQIAARMPLSQIVRAVELAESRTVAGKVVVTADA